MSAASTASGLLIAYAMLQVTAVLVNGTVMLQLWCRATTMERRRGGGHLLVMLLCVVNVCWCLPGFVGSLVALQNDAMPPLGASCAVLGFFVIFGWLGTVAIVAIMSYYSNRMVEGYAMKNYAVVGSVLLTLAIALLLAGLPAADVGMYMPSPDLTFCFMDWGTPITSVSLVVFVFSALFMASTSYMRMFAHINLQDLERYVSVSDAHIDASELVTSATSVENEAAIQLTAAMEAEAKDIQIPGTKHVTLRLRQVVVMNGMMLWLWIGYVLVIVIALQHLREKGEDVPRSLYGATIILTYLQAIVNPIFYASFWLRWFGIVYDF